MCCINFSPQISNYQCGGTTTGYEILYYQLRDSSKNVTVFFEPDIPSNQTQVSYTIHHLQPYTQYSVQVRTVIQISGGSQRPVSNFSQPHMFMTLEGGKEVVPLGAFNS